MEEKKDYKVLANEFLGWCLSEGPGVPPIRPCDAIEEWATENHPELLSEEQCPSKTLAIVLEILEEAFILQQNVH